MDKNTEILLAVRWFKDHGIPITIDDDNSIFIEVRKESFQISSAEISYRADQYSDENPQQAALLHE